MDKLFSLISAIVREPFVQIAFGIFACFQITYWTDMYFFKRKLYSQSELMEISPEFFNTNTLWHIYSLGGFAIFIVVAVALFFTLKTINPNGLIVIFPLMFCVFGITRALLAFTKGVYQIGRTSDYIYADRAEITRIAKIQLTLSIIIVVACLIAGFFIRL